MSFCLVNSSKFLRNWTHCVRNRVSRHGTHEDDCNATHTQRDGVCVFSLLLTVSLQVDIDYIYIGYSDIGATLKSNVKVKEDSRQYYVRVVTSQKSNRAKDWHLGLKCY